MTHEDVIVKIIAENAGVSIKEAKDMFKDFRHDFPVPDSLDRELSPEEADAMLNFYRNNPALLQWISRTMAQYGREH